MASKNDVRSIAPRDQHLIQAFTELKIGDAYEETVIKIGRPDVDRELIGKQGQFVARILRFYFVRIDERTANENDKYVELVFDQNGRLNEIASNVPGVVPKKNDATRKP